MGNALRSAVRLSALRLPSPLVARLWRSVVLPQACYGAEVRDIRPQAVSRLALFGRTILRNSEPLHLARWAAPEVLSGRTGDKEDPLVTTDKRAAKSPIRTSPIEIHSRRVQKSQSIWATLGHS